MKLLTYYSTSHYKFYKDFFEPSFNTYLKDDFQLHAIKVPQHCESGNFCTKGWQRTMLEKVNWIVENIDPTNTNPFVYSDCDVQFLNPIHADILKDLENFDIKFQDGGACYCAGFFIARQSNKILQFFKSVQEELLATIDKDGYWFSDQAVINNLLRKITKIKAGKLPRDKYFSYGTGAGTHAGPWRGNDFKVPETILMHHGNQCIGVENKHKLMTYVKNQVEDLRYTCRSPVLLVVYNRPELTTRVFEAIRKVKPSVLYIHADGPKAGEEECCAIVRGIVSEVDWSCRVVTQFSDTHLGCGKGVSRAITFLFQHEDRGIILEDDCLPSVTFFKFCDELLEYYKDNARVFRISGYNPCAEAVQKTSYGFSKYMFSWGWATWKRAWDLFSFTCPTEPLKQTDLAEDPTWWDQHGEYDQLLLKFKRGPSIDTWDNQWAFTCIVNHGLTIVPCKNLVENIGFGIKATHTHTACAAMRVKSNHMEFPLKHPKGLERDKIFEHNFFTVQSGKRKIIYKNYNENNCLPVITPPTVEDLRHVFNCYGTDKSIRHGYHNVYQPIFRDYIDKPVSLLEVGILAGSSIQAWLDYFPEGNIYCIDNFPYGKVCDIPVLKNQRVHWLKISSTDPDLEEVLKHSWNGVMFDFIIDDARHTLWNNQATLDVLKKFLKAGGTYFIEDLLYKPDQLKGLEEWAHITHHDLRGIYNMDSNILALTHT